MTRSSLCVCICLATIALGWQPALAAPPCDELLPASTKGFVSITNLQTLADAWRQTEVGQYLETPEMKAFAEDVKEQISNQLTDAQRDIGLTWDDVQGLVSGEFAAARVRDPAGASGLVVLLDVTGKIEQAEKVLEKVNLELRKRGATRKDHTDFGHSITVFTLRKNEKYPNRPPRIAAYFLKDNFLVATDNLSVAGDVIARLSGKPKPTLAQVPAYKAVMQRCQKAAGEHQPHLRWFVEPIAFAEAVRDANPEETAAIINRLQQKRNIASGETEFSDSASHTDLVALLKHQGFEAIRGAGGYVHFNVDAHYQVLQHSAVFAPGPFDLAARMLKFPAASGEELAPMDWVPVDLANHTSFRWDMQAAFDSCGTLIDEIMGSKGAFADTLEGYRTDEFGPKIDIRKEVIGPLSHRGTVLTDYRLPIAPDSERLAFTAKVDDVERFTAAIHRALDEDPNVRGRKIAGVHVWEIFGESEEVPEVDIEGTGSDNTAQGVSAQRNGPKPSAAVTVAFGHLIVSTHLDMVERLLTAPMDQRLAQDPDYLRVQSEFTQLGAENCSLTMFTRMDRELRPTYELIKTGKLPESQTLLGRLLNRLVGQGPDDEARKQRIDGSSLPAFEGLREKLGPAGLFGKQEFSQNEADFQGWIFTGFLLSK